jgi:hypothetical protein
MKKKLIGVLFFTVLLFGVAPTAHAAQGNWVSTWQWDANGVSSVGTANATNETGNFTFRVVRAGGAWIGNQNVTLRANQSSSASFWGQPFLDRQGQVLIAARFWHAPWFSV